MKLNLGSGFDNREGYINVDNDLKTYPNLVLDLDEDPLPFEDSSADEVLAFMLFEHINDLESLVNEIYRVLKPNGILKIKVPFMHSQVALNHVRVFDDLYFDSWNKEWYEEKEGKGTHQYNFNFKATELEVRGHWFARLFNNHVWHRFFAPLLTEIYVELEAVKRKDERETV